MRPMYSSSGEIMEILHEGLNYYCAVAVGAGLMSVFCEI